MSKDLDNIINTWNQHITSIDFSKKAASKDITTELKRISRTLDSDPEAFNDFSVETHGHFSACDGYNSPTEIKCICNIILTMVIDTRKTRENFRNQLRNEKEKENN